MIDIGQLTLHDMYRAVYDTETKKMGFLVGWNYHKIQIVRQEDSRIIDIPWDQVHFLVDNPQNDEDKAALQDRCVHCHKKLNTAMERSSERKCPYCQAVRLSMTNKDWIEVYNRGKGFEDDSKTIAFKAKISELESQLSSLDADSPLREMLEEEIQKVQAALQKHEEE